MSRRGDRLVHGLTGLPYSRLHFERAADRFDPVANPGGYIGLCVAENLLTWDLLEPRLNGRRHMDERSAGYGGIVGAERFRSGVAALFEERIFGRPVDPSDLAVLAGAGTVLESLFYAIGDPGDGVLVPTPGYGGFWLDLEARDDLVIVPVHTPPEDGFRLSTDLLDAAFDSADRPVRALLFTSPDNPLGRVYGAEDVEMFARWTEARGIHLVVDEIYALSVFGETPFTSIGRVRRELGPYIHVVWSFSKDFGVSGLRAGVLVTENREVLEAARVQSMWGAVSGDTQSVLASILLDREWRDTYLAESRARLGRSYAATADALRAGGIPFTPAAGGFFVLIDLRAWLDEPTWEAERRLWHRLLDETNVNLTPGEACRVSEPGFMRLVYTVEPPSTVEIAIRRVGSALGRRVVSS